MIKIMLDARILSQKMCGVARYVIHLINYLKTFNQIKLYLISDTPIQLEYNDIIKGLPLIITQKNKLWKNKLLPKILSDYNIDLYHATWDKGIPLHSPCPTIMTIHDLYIISKYSPHAKKLIKRSKIYINRFLEAHISKKIITVSQASKKHIVDFLFVPANKINVTYLDCERNIIDNAIKSNEFSKINKWKLDRQKYFISIVGRLNDVRKNIPYLVSAYADFILKNKSLNYYKLVIVGDISEDAKETKKMMTIIQKNKLENNVIITKFIPDNVMYLLLKNAKAMIFTSLFEGFGIPLLEAFYLKVPVITSNTTSLKEIGGQGRTILVDPFDFKSLSKSLLFLLKNNDKIKTMINDAYSYLNNFSWNNCAKQTVKVYSEVLSYKKSTFLINLTHSQHS